MSAVALEISKDHYSFKHNSCSDSSCTGPRGSWKVCLSSLNMSFVLLMLFSKISPKIFPRETESRCVSSLYLPPPLPHPPNQIIQPRPRGRLDTPSSLWLPWVRLNDSLIGQLLAKSVKANNVISVIRWFLMLPRQAVMLLFQAPGLLRRDCALGFHLTFEKAVLTKVPETGCFCPSHDNDITFSQRSYSPAYIPSFPFAVITVLL